MLRPAMASCLIDEVFDAADPRGRALPRQTLCFAVIAVALLSAEPASAALNDSGFYLCRNFKTAVDSSACAGTGQDGETGRDTSFPSDVDGWKGFTFRKVCNSGELAGTGNCNADPPFGGDKLKQWSCVLDEWTGLMWEAKLSSNDPVRGAQRIFSWSDGSVAEYVATMNASRLCGHDDWRLPTPGEALGLANYAVSYAPGRPMIDRSFFDGYSDFSYWTYSRQGDLEAIWVTGYTPAGAARTSGSEFGLYAIRVVRDALVERLNKPSPSEASTADEGEILDAINGLTWARCSLGKV